MECRTAEGADSYVTGTGLYFYFQKVNNESTFLVREEYALWRSGVDNSFHLGL